ncbi:LOG family protein [Polaribacter sejongensis]|uniref:LOG family protein n=1 Tax=Polaribacter sejongensis TaxID=985043 RepID=UPI0035A58F96
MSKNTVGLLNINGFFDAVILQLDKMIEEGFLKQTNRDMLIVGTSVEDLMQKMEAYEAPKMSHVINKVVS